MDKLYYIGVADILDANASCLELAASEEYHLSPEMYKRLDVMRKAVEAFTGRGKKM